MIGRSAVIKFVEAQSYLTEDFRLVDSEVSDLLSNDSQADVGFHCHHKPEKLLSYFYAKSFSNSLKQPGLKVINLCSCSAQPIMKFQLLIN